MQKTLYEGQRSISNQRVWSINRNYFLGSQRYAYGTWSGDISSGFFSMAKQRERMLSAINIGQVKWGMDSGGFHGTPNAENYARWIQFSAFTPMFRVHGTLDEQRQPWLFGEQAEAVSKEAIELRYQLIPYMYSYERQAYETGIGLVKPLFYQFPNDEKLANDVESWMFGDHLLVSPVVEEGQTSKSIYLPEGQWIDYFKGKKYDGGQTISYPLNAKTWEDIPLFIREGAIIPQYPIMNYVGEREVEQMAIHIFPSTKQSEFVLYDDDGETYDYERGEYMRQEITVKKSASGKVVISLQKPTGNYQSPTKTYRLLVHDDQLAKLVKAPPNVKMSAGEPGPYGLYRTIDIPAGKALTLEFKANLD
jgi:alpha-glucosidase